MQGSLYCGLLLWLNAHANSLIFAKDKFLCFGDKTRFAFINIHVTLFYAFSTCSKQIIIILHNECYCMFFRIYFCDLKMVVKLVKQIDVSCMH